MQTSTRAQLWRTSAACAAATMLIGGLLTAGTASAAPVSEPPPSATASAGAPSVAASPATAASSAAPLPGRLAQALERDLGMSLEEFNAQGALATQASAIQAQVSAVDPAAVVTLTGDTITVKTSAPGVAKAAAGNAKVKVSDVVAAPPAAQSNPAGIDALVAAYAAEFGVGNLQSIMINGSGNYVIRTGDAATGGPITAARRLTAGARPTPHDFAAFYNNVTIQAADGPADAFADVTNGQGYVGVVGQMMAACSIGWSGFNATGAAAVLSAGHCTEDGAAVQTALTDPTKEPAEGGPGYVPTMLLGTFGASQFGGPNNTPATAPPGWDGNPNTANNIGTDFSVIDKIDPALNLLPQVTDWTTPEAPKNAGPKVTGVSTAIVGAPICKSGRTTGWTCGTVTEVGAFFVAGITYPKELKACTPVATVPECDDIRAVRGFGSTSLAGRPGDSGGSIIAGTLAVGMVSAGVPGEITYGVDLKDALKHTAGYTVKIFLEAPTVTTAAPVFRKGTITGSVAGAPAGTKVSVSIDGVATEVAVAGNGKWTAKAPNKFGTFDVTAQAKNGFSTSASTTATIAVIKETLAAPAITSPADGSNVGAPVTTIAGTGKAGATVELSGDVNGTAVVGAGGTWSFTVQNGLDEVGFYAVTAKQRLTDWNDSPASTSDFTVAPAAPAITSLANGQKFAFNQGPSVISGTNLDQATVRVSVDGRDYNAVVVGTTWSVTLGNQLATGNYSITAVQQWGGFRSLSSSFTVTVLAEPAPPATQAPAAAPGTAPTKAPVYAAGLANTGASGSLLLLGGAGVLLLLGGAAFLLIRRRNAR